MNRRTRIRICVWLIMLGLGNFLAYAVVYAVIGGDAHNGYIKVDDAGERSYYVRGHFIHREKGKEQDVSKGVWIYSYIHSISIWPSIAVVLVAMMSLARPHIMATYQQGVMKGSTLVTVMITLIITVTVIIMINFTVEFILTLNKNR